MLMPAASSPALEITGLTVAYDGAPVLWDASLTVPEGCVMGIVGPNGAGKSTLLHAVLGHLKPLAGQVRVHGREVAAVRRRVAFVPQRRTVDWDFPTSVLDIVTMGTYGRLGWFRRPGKKEREQALAALDRVEMRPFAARQISELSGGQQQRVFLARAFVQDADLLLLDEPFAGVDAKTERVIVRLLQEQASAGRTVVVVHHDLGTVATYFDRVALLNRELICHGPVDTAFTEAHLERTYGGPVRLQASHA